MRLGLPSLFGLTLLALPASAQDISLRLPVACELGRSCFIQKYVDHDPSPVMRDYQCGALGEDGHDGTDIRLPSMVEQRAGVDVVAAADGKVASTREGVPDAFVTEQTREKITQIGCGNAVVIDHGQGWRTAYCHMAKGSLTVRSGREVKAGDKIGQVGLSGLTEFPHLHFTVIKDGKPVDPFAYGSTEKSCGGGKSLWEASLQRALAYQAGTVLNKGFAPGPVTVESIETGVAEQDTPTTKSPALVAYVRVIALKGGDVATLTLFDPDGKPLAQNKAPPLDRDKIQWIAFAGVKQPEGGFRPGLYRAIYRVERDGKPAIEQAFGINLRP
ncbi:M23 family metallopeptidase [Microvirga terrestris]|uniref:M23 family metallopeptidase n=1 Tax=Microvirga terrestris TaxID=2791024 RepID=A0ABS0HVW5_9HYPH|nr:M23 family metallopeptidase [Microvirga terrestris]MBF9197499.1 M23 family metallopeptidase [Microvirga terrestris]